MLGADVAELHVVEIIVHARHLEQCGERRRRVDAGQEVDGMEYRAVLPVELIFIDQTAGAADFVENHRTEVGRGLVGGEGEHPPGEPIRQIIGILR